MVLETVDQIIEASINKGFPSCQLLVAHNNKIIKHQSYGYLSLTPQKQLASINALYDIASLTKIFSITYGFQYLVTHEAYDLDTPLITIFPEYSALLQAQNKKAITVRALLSHSAGFEANPLYYDQAYSEILFSQNDRSGFIEKLITTPLIHPPFTQALYSDVDYMLLTFILERITQMPLEVWLDETFWQPLKINSIMYNPLQKSIEQNRIAPTELHGNTRDGAINFLNVRQKGIHGEVQDEKAYHCMAGISGHAGLFANTEALYKLFTLMIRENKFFSQAVKNEFLSGSHLNPSFGLGWRLNRGEMSFTFGDFASDQAFGHTGWTGCVMLHDPAYNLAVIYLTNRKHTRVLDLNTPNIFLGDTLPAGEYRTIINALYKDLNLG